MTLQVFKCCVCIWIGVFSETMLAQTQKVVFSRDFSPAEGLVTPQEKPYRDEVCLNGLWDLQCVAVPSSWEKRFRDSLLEFHVACNGNCNIRSRLQFL